MEVTAPRPHHLLRLRRPDISPAGAPSWVRDALLATPWVVVRRAESPEGLIAVGVRGGSRAERYAMTIAVADIAESVAPEDLTQRTSRDLPALRALAEVRTALDRTGWSWGPTGSVGFELATGVPTATEESDLDLVVRVPRPTVDAIAQLTELHQLLTGQPARIDCQVEITCGAVALAELITDQSEILLRTETGPQLISWAGAVS